MKMFKLGTQPVHNGQLRLRQQRYDCITELKTKQNWQMENWKRCERKRVTIKHVGSRYVPVTRMLLSNMSVVGTYRSPGCYYQTCG
jgi:hypothetical protein